MFKVVPDQLRISEGWVRCGQCAEIFNASQQLLTRPRPLAEAGRASSAVAYPPAKPQQAPKRFAPPAVNKSGPTAAPAPHHPPAGTSRAAAPLQPAHEAATAPPRFVAQEPRRADPPPVADTWPQETSTVPAHEVSFLQAGASTSTFWQRRSVRMLLTLLATTLAAALAAQLLIHERNRIAQIEPATRPVLVALCALAQCELGPLKQIESIVIDSSTFATVRAENYRLEFSLRNTATLDVAMPSIELSLTDAQDQTLVRRVIRPDEFGAPTPALPTDSSWSGALTLNVKLANNTDRIAGYRLLAFYP
jgi:predicted Zn finger-like uncharacterized protein